jgi:DNA-binding NtrC family response regulator
VVKKFTLLVADRNRHVREFLKRELIAEGYRVNVAKNGQEVLKWAYAQGPLDLLILDVDLPDASEIPVLEILADRIPVLPVVVHSFSSDYRNNLSYPGISTFVEKSGNSVEQLKKVVFNVLRNAGRESTDIPKDDREIVTEL